MLYALYFHLDHHCVFVITMFARLEHILLILGHVSRKPVNIQINLEALSISLSS